MAKTVAEIRNVLKKEYGLSDDELTAGKKDLRCL